MIPETIVNRQLKRLTNLPFAPKETDALVERMRELRRIVDRDVRSEEHLIDIIDGLIEHAQSFPPPSELVAAIQATPDPKLARGPMGCGGCHGTGWYSYTRNGYDFATFCTCELGQWKKAAVKAHEEEREARKRAGRLA